MKFKRQHYVPRFYLKNFALKRKSGNTIRCFNKEKERSFEENIDNVGMENYFYDKGAPPQIDKFFAVKEELHSKIYHKIINSQSLNNLSESEKFLMCEYIFFQNERTRSTRERNRQIVKKIYKKLEKENGYPEFESLPEEYQEWLLESRGEMAQLNILFNVFKDEGGNLQSPKEIIGYIMDLGWNLTENNLANEFYTSDHPIIIYNPIYEGDRLIGYGSDSYRAEGVEIYFPLTPNLCLILFDKIRSNYKNVPSKKFVIEKELDWINTQVIANSHRTVFTRKNDFQFVKDCLKKYPELKDPNRNRIFYYNLTF